MSWFTANLPWVSSLLWDHLVLALPPMILSILIALPIGRLAYRYPRSVVFFSKPRRSYTPSRHSRSLSLFPQWSALLFVHPPR